LSISTPIKLNISFSVFIGAKASTASNSLWFKSLIFKSFLIATETNISMISLVFQIRNSFVNVLFCLFHIKEIK
jgi:hypothetical protein